MSIAITIGAFFLIVGLAGVFAFVLRKIPLLLKLNPEYHRPHSNLKERAREQLKVLKYLSYRPVILSWLEKILRKIRLFILKIDNRFNDWIKRSREKSDVWTIRSKAWSEHKKLEKRQKIQVLEHLDKVEVSQSLEKIKKEVAKEEDKALLEKIESAAEADIKEEAPEEQEAVVSDEERHYIDMIAENPKNVEAYRALGFMYLRQKNYEDSRASFRQVLKLNPEDSEIKEKLEEINGLKSKKI